MKTLREKILKAPNRSFTPFEEKGAVLNCTFHTHPEYELTRVISGRGELFVNTEITSFEPGTLCLFGSELPHNYINYAPGAHVHGIQFGADFAGPFFLELPEFTRIRQMLENSAQGLLFPRETSLQCALFLEKISNSGISTARSFLLFLELLVNLSESEWTPVSKNYGPPVDTEADPRICKAIGLIQKGIGTNSYFTLPEIAREVCLSPDVFSRYFSRITGRTYMEYVTGIRIGKASELLSHTKKNVSEICFECGFRNLSNFNRIFLREKGLSPRQFRAKFPG